MTEIGFHCAQLTSSLFSFAYNSAFISLNLVRGNECVWFTNSSFLYFVKKYVLLSIPCAGWHNHVSSYNGFTTEKGDNRGIFPLQAYDPNPVMG